MMLRVATLALAAVGAGAFQAPRRAATKATVTMAAKEGMSKSVPFLRSAPALDGSMAGDSDFDPMNLSGIDFDWSSIVVPKFFNEDRQGISTLYWMREAELKHSRIAMLAVLGYVATDMGVYFPGTNYGGISSLDAHDVMVQKGNMGFMLFCVFILEALSGVAVYEAAKGSGRAPGDFGFDPLGFGKGDDKKKAKYATNEIKNGRLAMLAFAGIVTQAALTEKGFPYF